MYNYNKSRLSPYDPTKLAIYSILRPEIDFISNCGPNVKKTVSFDDFAHFIDEENIVTYVDFDCGITSLTETPTKIRQINRDWICISRSYEKPQCIASNNQHVCLVDEQHSSNIVLTPYILWDMSPAALMSLNHNNDTYSMSNQYPQPTTHQSRTDSYPVFSSMRTMDSKRRDCASAWHSFKEIIYRTDEWTKQLLRLKSWMISGSPEQWTECRRLWWTVIVFKCSYLLQLFDSNCLLVQNLLFLEIYYFVSFFDDFEWQAKVHWQPQCKVTLP